MGDGFYQVSGQKTQPTVSKYWRRKLWRKQPKKRKENTNYTYGHRHKI